MKHTHLELQDILRELIMDDGLRAVVSAIGAVLLKASDTAFSDYESTGLRSSRELAKAWLADADVVVECRRKLGDA
jgi:hypothetical protein